MKFVVLESDSEGGAYIQYIKAKNYDKAFEKYGGESIIVLNEDDYYNMCQAGVGA